MENIVEEWRPIVGYTNYEVSSLGRVRSLGIDKYHPSKILKPWFSNKGYPLVDLHLNGKRIHKLVSRLVGEAFIPNPKNLPFINHKDENPKNNRVDNLEWCDAKYNANYGTAIERQRQKVIKAVICTYLKTGEKIKYPSLTEAEKVTGVNRSKIWGCCNGVFSQSHGFTFEYA